MENRNIKLIISYDGTGFSGWQVQADQRTVQGEIEKALAKMHKHPVSLTGAGRTDAGVHATGQVGNFFTDLNSIDHQQFRDAINYYLPQDVRVLESSIVNKQFSARFSARMRIYRYFFYFGPVNLPHLNRYAVRRREKPDIKLLNQYTSVLIGDHDFTTFAAAGDMSSSKKRIVYSASFYPRGNFLVFMIKADSFLYKMVRSLVGTFLDCVKKGIPREEFAGIVLARDRSKAGCTAPARGLFLDKVIYSTGERAQCQ